MKAFLQKNKLMLSVLGLLFLCIAVTSFFRSGASQKSSMKSDYKSASATDNASQDTTAESLNALTQKLHQVISSNQSLQSDNAALNQKNDQILKNIRAEVQQNLSAELARRGQNDEAKIADLEAELQKVNAEIQQSSEQGITGSGGSAKKLNGEALISIPDLSGQSAEEITSSRLNAKSAQEVHRSPTTSHPTEKPTFTIPSGSTLDEAVTMTALIGRVPVDGIVKAPYPFKMIIGGNNLAANGLSIPGISGAIIQGYTVGDMALSCVKGYVTALTFLFPDGTISTTQMTHSSGSEDLGFTDALGYLSTPHGNPCFPGKFYTNAPQYLATMVGLGAMNQGGQAYAMAQQTSMSNSLGGATTALTGSVGKYMMGGAVQGGTQQVMDWMTAREKNSFDAVYVPTGQKAVVNITQEIQINYDPAGRKVAYGNESSSFNNTSLD
jgi:hypothetical protein